MFKLRNKLNKKGGFTLIEMLIVVAIIAILIAVSIPVIGTALERTRIATDAANERAARAEITIAYMTGKVDGTNKLVFTTDTVEKLYAYDAQKGVLLNTGTPTVNYGKCEHHNGGYIMAGINANGEVTLKWYDGTTSAEFTTSDGKKLCGTRID